MVMTEASSLLSDCGPKAMSSPAEAADVVRVHLALTADVESDRNLGAVAQQGSAWHEANRLESAQHEGTYLHELSPFAV